MPFTEEEKKLALQIARGSIELGFQTGRQPAPINLESFPDTFRQTRSCFVSLFLRQPKDELRGCIGHLEAHQSLAEDIHQNAFASAFRDPRFPPLTKMEYETIKISISVLHPAEQMIVSSENDLLSQLRPGVDGLILQEGFCRSTFLPAVWESLSTPQSFLNMLKVKAGLPATHWSSSMQFWRYTTESLEE